MACIDHFLMPTLTLLRSECPKLDTLLDVLSAVGLDWFANISLLTIP